MERVADAHCEVQPIAFGSRSASARANFIGTTSNVSGTPRDSHILNVGRDNMELR